jgi:adenosylcobinamide kinase / adenosylcobinamide-phosphate guanylyltransferase
MVVLIIGGSGSGKSAYAEQRALEFGNHHAYYAATMEAIDLESKRRVERHRQLRAGGGWITLEQSRKIEKITTQIEDYDSVVLLECLSNLVANEMYGGDDEGRLETDEFVAEECARQIVEGIQAVSHAVENLVIVSNNVFEDGTEAVPELRTYLKVLGFANQMLAEIADEVVEVVVGIPVFCKSSPERSNDTDENS